MEEMMFWSKFSALATMGTGVVLLVTLIAIFRQIMSSRQAQQLQGFIQVVGWLQKEDVRKARRRVYQLRWKDYKKWSAEDRWEAEKVCYNFDVVGDMLKQNLTTERVPASWGWIIQDCWAILKPMVEEYREDRRYTRLWERFEWLAEKVYRRRE